LGPSEDGIQKQGELRWEEIGGRKDGVTGIEKGGGEDVEVSMRGLACWKGVVLRGRKGEGGKAWKEGRGGKAGVWGGG